MSEGNKLPITRINKFFGYEDFRLEVAMGREAIEGDGNFIVVLFKVDREGSASDELYGEAGKDEIKYFPPVELRVMPILNPPENKVYNEAAGTGRYQQDGQLIFAIFEEQLFEMGVDIDYGDYIGYQVSETMIRYYAVTNDGKKNFDNAHTIMGWRGAFRTVTCAPVDQNEFRSV